MLFSNGHHGLNLLILIGIVKNKLIKQQKFDWQWLMKTARYVHSIGK